MLEIRHLRIVDAIARAGTVTEAAKRVHLTQPAVSHALGELETRLGVKLFDRAGRRMVPTEEGRRLLVTAERVLVDVADAEHDLRRFRDGVRGVLRLATECYTCYHWLPPVLRRFQDAYPDVELSLVPEESFAPLEALRSERLDVAIVHTEPTDRALVRARLFTDELVLIVQPGHPLAERPFVEAADFAEEVLLLHSEPEDSIVWTTFLAPSGVRPRRVLTMRLTEALLESVKAGLGVSVVARWVAQPEIRRETLRAVPITGQGLFRTWSAVTRRRDARRAALRSLIDLLKEGPLPGARSPSADASNAA